MGLSVLKSELPNTHLTAISSQRFYMILNALFLGIDVLVHLRVNPQGGASDETWFGMWPIVGRAYNATYTFGMW